MTEDEELHFLLRSKYFERYTLPDWMARHPDEAMQLIRQVRLDPVSEADVQYHLRKVEGHKKDQQKQKKRNQ